MLVIKNLKTEKLYIKDLFGLDELGLPIRYMFIPETEIVSYSENMQLATPEGSFELIVRESPDASTNVAVGDPAIDFVKSLAGKAWGVFTGGIGGEGIDIIDSQE